MIKPKCGGLSGACGTQANFSEGPEQQGNLLTTKILGTASTLIKPRATTAMRIGKETGKEHTKHPMFAICGKKLGILEPAVSALYRHCLHGRVRQQSCQGWPSLFQHVSVSLEIRVGEEAIWPNQRPTS